MPNQQRTYRKMLNGLEVSLRSNHVSVNIPVAIQKQIISCTIITAKQIEVLGTRQKFCQI